MSDFAGICDGKVLPLCSIYKYNAPGFLSPTPVVNDRKAIFPFDQAYQTLGLLI